MMYLASLTEEMKDKVDGYKFIHTKTELDKIVVNNLVSNRVVIRRDFAHEFFTPTGLVEYVNSVKKFNYNIVIELDGTDEVVTKESLIDMMKGCRNIEELIQLAVFHDREFMDVLSSLIEHRESDYNKMLEFSNQVARLQSIIDGLHSDIEEKEYQLATEQRNKYAAQAKLHALISRINYQYNVGVDKNKLFSVDKNSYDKILYIKEITRVQYIDSFVYYLQEILKTIYTMPTRVLVIESYYADGKIQQYPNLKPHHSLIERDVLKGDILMLGMQPNLMQDILKNASNISILLVVDRAGYSTPHIWGENVEVLYTVSDLKDVPADVNMGRVISYDENTLFIKYIEDFDKLDASGKISAYSSMSLMKKVIKLLERKQ